jgi:hypothetical protein
MQYTEMKRVDPDSEQYVISANPPLPALKVNVENVVIRDISQGNVPVIYGEQGLCFSSYLCVQGVCGTLTTPRPVGTEKRMSGNSQPEREANSTSSSVEIMKFLSNITTSPSVSSLASNILLNTFFLTTCQSCYRIY